MINTTKESHLTCSVPWRRKDSSETDLVASESDDRIQWNYLLGGIIAPVEEENARHQNNEGQWLVDLLFR